MFLLGRGFWKKAVSLDPLGARLTVFFVGVGFSKSCVARLAGGNMIAHEREFVNFFFGGGLSETGTTAVFSLMTWAVPDSHGGPSSRGAGLAFILPTAERLDTAACSIEPKIFSFSLITSWDSELMDVCACGRSRSRKPRATSTFNVGCAKGDDQ
jgi:hypothetical protein